MAVLSGTPEEVNEHDIVIALEDGINADSVLQEFTITVEPEIAIITVFDKDKFTGNFYFAAVPSIVDANCTDIKFYFKIPEAVVTGEINVYDAVLNNVFTSSIRYLKTSIGIKAE